MTAVKQAACTKAGLTAWNFLLEEFRTICECDAVVFNASSRCTFRCCFWYL